jgi:hypothetical protein
MGSTSRFAPSRHKTSARWGPENQVFRIRRRSEASGYLRCHGRCDLRCRRLRKPLPRDGRRVTAWAQPRPARTTMRIECQSRLYCKAGRRRKSASCIRRGRAVCNSAVRTRLRQVAQLDAHPVTFADDRVGKRSVTVSAALVGKADDGPIELGDVDGERLVVRVGAVVQNAQPHLFAQ